MLGGSKEFLLCLVKQSIMKLIYLVFLSILTSNTFGQFTTIPVTSSFFSPIEYVQTDDGGFLEFRLRQVNKARYNTNAMLFSISIIKYNRDMSFVKEEMLPGSDVGFAFGFNRLIKSGSKIFMLTMEKRDDDQKAKMSNIIAFEINPQTLVAGEKIVIAQATNIDQKMNGYYKNIKILFESSPDKKHHGLFIFNNQEKQFYISTLDENMKIGWQKKESIPDFKMDIEYFRSLQADNSGILYLLAASFYQGAVIAGFKEGGTSVFTHCNLNDEFINTGMFYSNTTDGSVWLVGTCKKEQDANVTGVFKVKIDKKTFNTEKVKTADIPDSLITIFAEANYASTKKKKYGLYHYNFRSRVLGNDENNLLLILECNDDMTTTTKYNTTIYSSGEITIVNFKATTTAFSCIRRYHRASNESEDGRYYPYLCSNKLNIVYADNAKNLTTGAADKPVSLRWDENSIMINASLDLSNGVITKKEIPISSPNNPWSSIKLFLQKLCDE